MSHITAKMVLNMYQYDDGPFGVSTSEIDKKFWDYFDVSSTISYNMPSGIEETVLRDQAAVLATYGVLLAVGGLGNLVVLVTLARTRRRKSRIDLLMTHLALADVCVTCGVIPLEIGWKYTNAWLVGNLLCKLLLVVRAFGLYLSSNILVCISIDRFFAVLYPLRLPVARRRSKQMLYIAWAAAIACSLPQSIVFRVKRHPRVAGFEQCVSFDAFHSDRQEVAYNVFCLCAMYFVPLVIITCCYLCIFCEIRRSSRELDEKCTHRSGITHVRLRRSGRRVLERARRRTLRMTVTIVSVFALCWLPYATMAMWYMIDRPSAERVSVRVQDLLFAMAVSNSCMNPLVYGSYTLDLRRAIRRFLKNTCCWSSAASDTIGNSGSSSTKKNLKPEAPLANGYAEKELSPITSEEAVLISFRTLEIFPSLLKFQNRHVRTRLGVRFAETSLTTMPERLEIPRPIRPPA